MAGVDWTAFTDALKGAFMTITAKPDYKEGEAQLFDSTRVEEMTLNGKMGEFIKDYTDAKMAAIGRRHRALRIKDQMERTAR